MAFGLELVIYFIVIIFIVVGTAMTIKGFSKDPVKNRPECIEENKSKKVGAGGIVFLLFGVAAMIAHIFMMYGNRN